jgi:aminocarboxymuconate-semialdehyde decarboxylase
VRELTELSWSPVHRLEVMDRWGVDVQLLSPLPLLLPTWAGADAAAHWCREVNTQIAEVVADGGDRFRGLGILPTQQVDAALAELDHVRRLGLHGVELATALDRTRTIGDPAADPLLVALRDAGVPVLVHPVRRGLLGDVPAVVDAGVVVPVDTTIALVPRLWPRRDAPMPNACVAHGGGAVPWLWPRLTTVGRDVGVPLPDWFRVDTAALGGRQIEYLLDVVGADRVLFGTDCPAADEGPVASQLEALDLLGPRAHRVLADNAVAHFGLS